jgi:hypothetical protein
MESILIQKGEDIYRENKERLERVYSGKVIAIEVESKAIAGIGETLDEAYEDALNKYPGKSFYFRKVGPCAAPTYLFRLKL